MRDKYLNKPTVYYLNEKKKNCKKGLIATAFRQKFLLYRVDRTIRPDHYPGKQSSHHK
jgi:hypothetical protein